MMTETREEPITETSRLVSRKFEIYINLGNFSSLSLGNLASSLLRYLGS